MIAAKNPFRYGKGSEHWKFNEGDPIKDDILDRKDIKMLLDKKLIEIQTESVKSSEVEYSEKDLQPPPNVEIDNTINKVESTKLIDLTIGTVIEAKENIDKENDVSSLVYSMTLEKKSQYPRKSIISAIERRVKEITGKLAY